MAFMLEILKKKDLIDEKQIWASGILQSGNGASSKAMENIRYLSIKGEEIIVSKYSNKQIIMIDKYTSKNVQKISMESVFFGFMKRLIVQKKDGTIDVYNISSHKKSVNYMIKLF